MCTLCCLLLPGVSPENSLSALFKRPAGSWECDTCLVQNTATAVRCLACDSSKPGLQTAGVGMFVGLLVVFVWYVCRPASSVCVVCLQEKVCSNPAGVPAIDICVF